MRKKISLKDVAIKAGVSTATVSYVLNNKGKQEKISEKVSSKILAAARSLNYQPNQIARSLKSGRTNTIGLILEDVSNPFFANLASFIEKKAQELGYTVIIGCHYENIDQSGKLLKTLILRQVDGILLTPMDQSEKQVTELKKSGIPYVLLDRYFSKVPSHTVTINNYEASREAVNHLYSQGYKQVGMIAFDAGFEHMADRVRGYQQSLKDHGNDTEQFLVKVPFKHSEQDIRSAIITLMAKRKRPDSFFFANNILAMQSIDVLNELELRVPGEIGLVSFDSRDAFNYFYSPLTYIEQNLRELGEQSLKLLVDNINRKPRRFSKIVVDAKLVIRSSSGRVDAAPSKFHTHS